MNIFELLRKQVSKIEDALDVLEHTKIIVDEFNTLLDRENKISYKQAEKDTLKRVYLKGCELLQKQTEPKKALNELINFVNR